MSSCTGSTHRYKRTQYVEKPRIQGCTIAFGWHQVLTDTWPKPCESEK